MREGIAVSLHDDPSGRVRDALENLHEDADIQVFSKLTYEVENFASHDQSVKVSHHFFNAAGVIPLEPDRSVNEIWSSINLHAPNASTICQYSQCATS